MGWSENWFKKPIDTAGGTRVGPDGQLTLAQTSQAVCRANAKCRAEARRIILLADRQCSSFISTAHLIFRRADQHSLLAVAVAHATCLVRRKPALLAGHCRLTQALRTVTPPVEYDRSSTGGPLIEPIITQLIRRSYLQYQPKRIGAISPLS